jgi:uracil phosphoribosyltransferase
MQGFVVGLKKDFLLLLKKLTILDQTNSLLNQFMAELRDVDIQQDGARFRFNLEKTGSILAYEISKTLKYDNTHIKTPLGYSEINLLADQPVLITIFRAGIPFFQGFLHFYDKAQSGFIGAKRSEPEDEKAPVETVDVSLGYHVIPNIQDRTIIIVDPMLATGNSLLKSINVLLKKGRPQNLHIACLIAAPEGITYLEKNLPIDFYVWAVSVDERLDERAFIYPGLGDAGDLSYGSSKI